MTRGRKRKSPGTYWPQGFLDGSGRRIRTLTYRVRVCCATLTQSRCVLTNKYYYTDSAIFVNSFFTKYRRKTEENFRAQET